MNLKTIKIWDVISNSTEHSYLANEDLYSFCKKIINSSNSKFELDLINRYNNINNFIPF